ncbi:MAG TPA: glycerophosphodiester phosphodiesterase family protein [Myxococcota bacterium]|jgi:glycerophosphoryl diester phosphodiesterase|nr:glycerophosphodiester phosphodiesterase family protein [Myxococcota bacterium]
MRAKRRFATAPVVLAACLATGCTGSSPADECVFPKTPTLNPAGVFADTLIRGRPPESIYAGNTWAALRDADALGYRWIEVDVRISADGVFVPARHDSLDKFTDCAGSLAAFTVSDLAACNNDRDGAANPVRPLADGLVDTSFEGVYLDLKSTSSAPVSTPDQIVAAVATLASEIADPTILVGMSYDEAAAAALLAAGYRAGLKGYPADTSGALALIDATAALGGEMVCVHLSLYDAATFQHAAEVGVWNLPWAEGTEINADSMALLIAGQAGGLISGFPHEVESLYSMSCQD